MDVQLTDRHFRKEERLCGEIRTTQLFAGGKGFIVYPIRIVYRKSDKSEAAPVQILISVPKKKLKHATDRNRIKRLIRESYRIQKQELIQAAIHKGISLHVGVVYLDTKLCDYATMQEKIKLALTKLTVSI